MYPLMLVISVCVALPGSDFQDHCREEVVPIYDTKMPNTCVIKAQQEIAQNPDRYSDGQITSIGCRRRGPQA